MAQPFGWKEMFLICIQVVGWVGVECGGGVYSAIANQFSEFSLMTEVFLFQLCPFVKVSGIVYNVITTDISTSVAVHECVESLINVFHNGTH